MTDAVMAVWGDTMPECDAEFSEWYHREHIPERVGMPGWRNGRRYRKLGRGKHRYLAAYDVDRLACFDDPVYRHALDNPTEWTSRMMQEFRSFVRATNRVRFCSGEVLGSVVATVRYDPGTGDPEVIARWLAGAALHNLRNREGITRVQHWEADMGRSLAGTGEQSIRKSKDGEAPFTAVIEGTDRAFVEAALKEAGIVDGLAERGAKSVDAGLYAMMFALHG